jgi:hypothetical protein
MPRKKKTETTAGNDNCPDCEHALDEHKKGGESGQAGEAVLCVHYTDGIRCQCEIKPAAETPTNNAEPDVARSDNAAADVVDEDPADDEPPAYVADLFEDFDPSRPADLADAAYQSGYFPGRTPVQLLITILAGQEMQLRPITALFDLELTPGSVRWKPGQPAQAAAEMVLGFDKASREGDRTVFAKQTGPVCFAVVDERDLPAELHSGESVVVEYPSPVVSIRSGSAAEPAADAGSDFDIPLSGIDALLDTPAADPFAVDPDGMITGEHAGPATPDPASAAEPPEMTPAEMVSKLAAETHAGVNVAVRYTGPERRREQMPPFMYDSERRSEPFDYENANKRPVLDQSAEHVGEPPPVPADATGSKRGEARPESMPGMDPAAGPIGDDPFASDNAGSGVGLEDDDAEGVTGPRDDEKDAAEWRSGIESIMRRHGHAAEVVAARLAKFDDVEHEDRRAMFIQAQEYDLAKVVDWVTKILAEITDRGFADVKAFALFAGVPAESSLWTWEDCDKATAAINTLPEK